jgi:uncharacterized protein (TIGR03435 family)
MRVLTIDGANRVRLASNLWLSSVISLAGWLHPVAAQLPPRFEVISIKPSTSDDVGSRVIAQPDGRFVMANVPVSALVLVAYELADYIQVDGLPEWTQKERVDFEARAPAGVPIAFPGQGTALPVMLRAALAERMKLSTHVEKRVMPMLALVKARDDGLLGPGLSPSSIDCTLAPSGSPLDSGAPRDGPQCGTQLSMTSFTARGIPLDRVIRLIIAPRVGRIVVDRTGLTGQFDVTLRFKAPERPAGPAEPASPATASDADLLPLDTAVQEQLGLKLRAIREPTDLLIVDRIEHPTPN